MIPQMPASSTWTVADCVAAIAVASPNRLAIELLDPRTNGVTPVETWTYGQVWARVEAFALAISQVPEGVHGPMVALMMPNSVDHLAAYLIRHRRQRRLNDPRGRTIPQHCSRCY